MMSRRLGAILFSAMGFLAMSSIAWAQAVRVMESTPAASAIVEGRSSEFVVRFDRPIDHVHSVLAIVRDGQVVEKLQPRLESAPDVLFARAPTLAPGDYKLRWAVRTMTGTEVVEGDIPFTVKQ